VTDLLLITDVPRLRKIFSKLSDNRDLHLRIANNLEKGAEELTAEKPTIIFVQTHLSGLSAEIILMHLKKQLGRKRSRFVLLATPAQATSETIRLYQGHIDTSLEDDALLNCIKNQIASLLAKGPKKTVEEAVLPEMAPAESLQLHTETQVEQVPAITVPLQDAATNTTTYHEEPSLVDQGLTYAPRPRMSVYSEFNSSFDSAVNDMQPSATLAEAVPEQTHTWDNNEIKTIEQASLRSKRASFLLWLAPVIIAAVVFTFLQTRRTTPTSPGSAQQSAPAGSERMPAPQKQPSDSTVVPGKAQLPEVPKSAVGPESALSDKAVLSAIAENRGNKGQAKVPSGSSRPTALPDFIPRYAIDRAYAKSNPGWERYRGQVTEFKVFREGNSIKAIQVIDHGGDGVPESFMKAALRQVSKNPVFVTESSEKKEGYEIQRGRVSENLKVMYYRDDQGRKLRAFVLTWQ
jgi:hypothetical protein